MAPSFTNNTRGNTYSGKRNNLSVNVDYPEKGTSHREGGEKTGFSYVGCDIRHESKS